jgi:transposase
MIHQDRVIGIDVGKRVHEAWVWPEERRLRGRADTLAAFVAEIAALAPRAIALEATGGYERPLADALHAAGLTVYILPPARVRAFARAGGQLAKTDKLDAALIARAYLACGAKLHPHQPSPGRDGLSQLLAQRRRLREEQSGLSSQLDTLVEPLVRRMVRQRLATIDRQIILIDREIARRIADDPAFTRSYRTLTAVKGVGPVLASSLIADMPELGHITGKAAAALLGVAPHARQSGASRRAGRCGGGRKHLRDILYMATLSAIKTGSGNLAEFYTRLRAAGKPAKLAITAAMRKLITTLNAIARNAETSTVA